MAGLQWGHALARVESISLRRCRERLVIASMGPRARARGIQVILEAIGKANAASMGPRARARGIDAIEAEQDALRMASMGPRARARGIDFAMRVSRALQIGFNGATR